MLPSELIELSKQFQKFPGVGKRSSQKMALDLLQFDSEDFQDFLKNIEDAYENIDFCQECGYFATKDKEQTLCEICKNSSRNRTQICLVEKPTDVLSLEKTEIYKGRYHVTKKLISPLDNVFVEHTNLPNLLQKRLPEILKDKQKVEIIVFFKAGFSSDATIAYIQETMKQNGWENKVQITRLAQGLPLYFNPETLDLGTMVKAFEDRR